MGGPRTFYSITGFHLRVFGVLSSSPSLPRSVLIDTNHFCGCRPLRSEISASLRLCVRLLLSPEGDAEKNFFRTRSHRGWSSNREAKDSIPRPKQVIAES